MLNQISENFFHFRYIFLYVLPACIIRNRLCSFFSFILIILFTFLYLLFTFLNFDVFLSFCTKITFFHGTCLTNNVLIAGVGQRGVNKAKLTKCQDAHSRFLCSIYEIRLTNFKMILFQVSVSSFQTLMLIYIC